MENRQSMVKVENLEVFYGGIQAIHGISLEVFQGEMAVSYTHLDVYKRQSQGSVEKSWNYQ